jgi:hypothetical protein
MWFHKVCSITLPFLDSVNNLFIVHCVSELVSNNINTVKGTLSVPEVTYIDLLKIVHRMTIKKSTGLYSISSFHLRECSS